MPQMSSLNWLFLYIYLLMILMMVNIILNYLYMSIYTLKDKNTIKKNFYKWMW